MLVVAVLSRRRGWYPSALNIAHTSFWVGYALLVQILAFYWLFDVRFPWYVPDLALGFKYYLDLLQFVPHIGDPAITPQLDLRFDVEETPLRNASLQEILIWVYETYIRQAWAEKIAV